MDLNCDLGEGLKNDAQIMPYITSCNIACGGHAGSFTSMKSTVLLAKKNNVKIGAHPSFIDRDNFGRKELFIPKNTLIKQIVNQIDSLKQVVEEEGLKLNHVKPHGALYNMAAKFNDVATAVVEAVKTFKESLIIYVPYNSLISRKLIELKMPFMYESFADRAYNYDLSLVSREEPEALIQNVDMIYNRVKQLLEKGTISTISGKNVKIKSETICVHGDNPNVVRIIKKISRLVS